MKWIDQYTGLLRQLRPMFWVYNLTRYSKLKQNKHIYKALGIKRSVLKSIDSRILSKFLDIQNPPPFLPEIEQEDRITLADLPEEIQELLKRWDEDGFIVLKGHFDKESVDRINDAVQASLQNGSIHSNYTGRKIFNAHKKLHELKTVTDDPVIMAVLNYAFKRPAVLFQTISFTKGSEQLAHSDFIHMTTLPLGNLAGVWVALEKMDEANGALTYYPGSHKIPYVLNADYGNSSNALFLDDHANKKYEQKVAAYIKEYGLKEHHLFIEPGDVLVWQANLLHGGAPIKDHDRTRKSMVSHYFAKDVLCFHEISERPAILK